MAWLTSAAVVASREIALGAARGAFIPTGALSGDVLDPAAMGARCEISYMVASHLHPADR
jgi:hypothetical protein